MYDYEIEVVYTYTKTAKIKVKAKTNKEALYKASALAGMTKHMAEELKRTTYLKKVTRRSHCSPLVLLSEEAMNKALKKQFPVKLNG